MPATQMHQGAFYLPLALSLIIGLGFFGIQILGTRLEFLARGPRPDDRFHGPENTLYAASVSAAIIVAYSINSETAPVMKRLFGDLALAVLMLWAFGLILAWVFLIKEKIRVTKILVAAGHNDLTHRIDSKNFWLVQFYNWLSALSIPLSLSVIAIR